jgi:hypothetical protein
MAAVTPTPTHRVEASTAKVHVKASWEKVSQTVHASSAPREPGVGARLAVRKYGDAINKLAD